LLTGIGADGARSAIRSTRARMTRYRVEDCERAHAVADEGGAFDRERFEQGDGANRRSPPPMRAARPRSAPMAGKTDREHVAPVMREVARLQRPDAVVVRRAVHEDDRRQRGIEGARPRIRVHRMARDRNAHQVL
jgi:hypothetical protein